MKLELLETTLAADVAPSRLPMIWRSRIPLGTLTVIAGRPGLGKSTLGTTIAAELSLERLNVVVSNQEDDLAAVVRPRLDVASADLKRVHLIPPSSPPIIPRDLDALAFLLKDTEASCLILDPIAAHFSPERRVHDRPLLRQLVALARFANCAIIGIHHVTKNTAGGAISAIGGPSSGLAGTARAVYMYGYDPEDEDRRALACVKVNGIEEPPALVLEHDTVEYRADLLYVEAGRLRVVEESNARARQTLAPGKRRADRDAAALEWLTVYLSKGDDCKRTVREIRADGAGAGYPWTTLKRAGIALKTEKVREGGWGAHGHWLWRLPDDHPVRHPELAEEPVAV